MVAQWWLEKNLDFMTIDWGGWLEGFCDWLTKEDLHPADWDHLEELKKWHEEQRELMEDNQLVVGPST